MEGAKPRWAGTVLVVVCGLPATGKSTAGRAISRELNASYVRIDTLEQAAARFADGAAADDETQRAALRHAINWGLGYELGYALAEDLLRQGLRVFAECVNPMKVTRDAWLSVAERTGAELVEIEFVCSDPAEHERRARSRTVDIPDLVLPTWQQILDREYEPWDRDHLVVDTAGKSPAATLTELRALLAVNH